VSGIAGRQKTLAETMKSEKCLARLKVEGDVESTANLLAFGMRFPLFAETRATSLEKKLASLLRQTAHCDLQGPNRFAR
jgi:hypothetical protein